MAKQKKIPTTTEKVASHASWLKIRHHGEDWAVKGYLVKTKRKPYPTKKPPIGFRPPSD